jgi:hypothetical protein
MIQIQPATWKKLPCKSGACQPCLTGALPGNATHLEEPNTLYANKGKQAADNPNDDGSCGSRNYDPGIISTAGPAWSQDNSPRSENRIGAFAFARQTQRGNNEDLRDWVICCAMQHLQSFGAFKIRGHRHIPGQYAHA